MHIEITETDGGVNTRNFNTDQGPRQRHEQQAYLHQPGSAYPLPFKIEVSERNSAYAPGWYTLTPDSIRTNQYGALEFNRFSMRLVRVQAPSSKSAASQSAVKSA